jgi:AraC family transcriptional regulator, transcriptional activator of pobA
MPAKIPSFDLYKKLETDLSFEFDRLEESYHEYDSSSPHRHNYYEIIFFNKAGGYHEIDFRQFDITADTIHFISPEQVHLLRRKKDVTGFVLSFTSDLLLSISSGQPFLSQFSFFTTECTQPLIIFNSQNRNQFLKIIADIENEFLSDNENKKQMLALLIGQLLLFCKRNYPEKESLTPGRNLTSRFMELINAEYRKYKSVSEYADLLHITSGHLNDTVQKQSGRTASELIHDRIVLEAKRLLYHSNHSVKEIAAQLNYEDPSYFTRFFKTHTGKTPEQFRKDIREKYH